MIVIEHFVNYLASWIKEGNWVASKGLIFEQFWALFSQELSRLAGKDWRGTIQLSCTFQKLFIFKLSETWKKLEKNQCRVALPWIWFPPTGNISVYFHLSKPWSTLSHFYNWSLGLPWISPVFLPCTHLLTGHHLCWFVTWPWWHPAGKTLSGYYSTNIEKPANWQTHLSVNNILHISWIHFQLMLITGGPRMALALHANHV